LIRYKTKNKKNLKEKEKEKENSDDVENCGSSKGYFQAFETYI